MELRKNVSTIGKISLLARQHYLLGSLFLGTCLGTFFPNSVSLGSSATPRTKFPSNFPGTGSQARLPGTIPKPGSKNRFRKQGGSSLLIRAAFTQRRFCPEKLFHRQAFAGRNFEHKQFLHTAAFTQRSLCADQLLHSGLFLQGSVYMEQLLHTEALTQRGLYTEKLLRTEVFTRKLYTEKFLHREASKQSIF